MHSVRTADASFVLLLCASWSVGDVRIRTAEGPAWLVTGSNGEHLVNARGGDQAEAWHNDGQQAEAAGMLRRRPSPPRA
jgi:hypothetical protein